MRSGFDLLSKLFQQRFCEISHDSGYFRTGGISFRIQSSVVIAVDDSNAFCPAESFRGPGADGAGVAEAAQVTGNICIDRIVYLLYVTV